MLIDQKLFHLLLEDFMDWADIDHEDYLLISWELNMTSAAHVRIVRFTI